MKRATARKAIAPERRAEALKRVNLMKAASLQKGQDPPNHPRAKRPSQGSAPSRMLSTKSFTMRVRGSVPSMWGLITSPAR